MGVATLSGLMPVFLEPTMTPTMMKPDTHTQTKEKSDLHITGDFQMQLNNQWESVSVSVCTLQHGGYEGRGHAAGAEQHRVAHLELPFRDPTENHGGHGGQEAHHGGLDLGGDTGGAGYGGLKMT